VSILSEADNTAHVAIVGSPGDTNEAANRAYVVITQVKSHRVIYYTDDPDFVPAVEEDWYYCGQYRGELPGGMTLRNCWSWRFNGSAFTHAGPAAKPNRATALVEQNKAALLRLLHSKIDDIRRPLLPSCAGGEALRAAKLQEANEFLAPQGTERWSYPLLESYCTARNIPLQEGAQLIIDMAGEQTSVMYETEKLREVFALEIQAATTQEQALDIRARMVDALHPALKKRLKFVAPDTVPVRSDAPMEPVHRTHEVARLKAQLMDAVNRKRRALQSGYVENSEARRRKVWLAQTYLSTDGGRSQGVDFSLITNLATARGTDVRDAAQRILDAAGEHARILFETEASRDQLLARIERVATVDELREVSQALEHFSLQVRKADDASVAWL